MDERIREILDMINSLERERLIVAIDGRCAAGKTTLAAELGKMCGCDVVHMDDFFLQPHQRTEQRLSQPGGNVDRERLESEVLRPLRESGRTDAIDYRVYDCHAGGFGETVHIIPSKINIVEGSYSCHPELWGYYDLHIFMTVDPDEQIRRIRERNGEQAAKVFAERWIPLEEKYFASFGIEDRCEVVFSGR